MYFAPSVHQSLEHKIYAKEEDESANNHDWDEANYDWASY